MPSQDYYAKKESNLKLLEEIKSRKCLIWESKIHKRTGNSATNFKILNMTHLSGLGFYTYKLRGIKTASETIIITLIVKCQNKSLYLVGYNSKQRISLYL